MGRLLLKWLSVYEDEVRLFLWSALLLFLIRGADILFNNVAETAFLKRYGVQYLPIVYMINAVATFFIMGLLTAAMARTPDSKLLTGMLMGSGLLVASLRFVIPLGIDLLYPILFILKSQLEVLLALVFWNMANDLFNTRQSKRLFPLITAGGVLGAIVGSFLTAPLARFIRMDNLLLVYFGVCATGAVVVHRLGTIYPTLLIQDPSPKGTPKPRVSMISEIKKIWPLMRESLLIKVLIFLTLMPNIVIPIINYQFNYAVNQNYATEGGMLSFFSMFRGFLNIISLVILLFVGKLYGRWGLPVALMIHPFNYILAFLAFLLRFDIYSAMYARISTNVLRATINNPARAVLMGLFPASQRAVVRPFLRGTVVRIGTLLGSGVILVSEHALHPRYLSLVALSCVGVWIFYDVVLKKQYVKIITDFISRGMLNLKEMKAADVAHVFKDKKAQALLLERFYASKGAACLWYADLLQSQQLPDLDPILLEAARRQDEQTTIGLLELLSADAGDAAVPVFRELMTGATPRLRTALAKTAARFPAEIVKAFSEDLFKTATDPTVKAYAAASLYTTHTAEIQTFVQSTLHSDDPNARRAGIIVVGETKDAAYVNVLKDMLHRETDTGILSCVIRGLHRLNVPELNASLAVHLSQPAVEVRLAALEAFAIEDEEGLRKILSLMGDPDDEVCQKAQEKIEQSTYQNSLILIKSLTMPSRKLREHLFDLLETLNIKAPDVYRFAQTQIKKAYLCLLEADALRAFSGTPERDLLKEHLAQEVKDRIETVLRVLSIQDPSGQIRIIWRSLFSSDSRQRANGIEALTDTIDRSLSKILTPLVEDLPLSEKMKAGKKEFAFPDVSDKTALISHLLEKPDWVTVFLALTLLEKEWPSGMGYPRLGTLESSENPWIRKRAAGLLHRHQMEIKRGDAGMEAPPDLTARMLQLKTIGIFQGLTVAELAAVSTVLQFISCGSKEVVMREGDPGNALYLIMEGGVSVMKKKPGRKGLEIATLTPGDYFGEMALLDEAPRSASILTTDPSRFMVLYKADFDRVVSESPQIALNICKTLSRRIRSLHECFNTSSGERAIPQPPGSPAQ